MRLSTIALVVIFALGMPITSITSQAGQAALEAAGAGDRSRQKEDALWTGIGFDLTSREDAVCGCALP